MSQIETPPIIFPVGYRRNGSPIWPMMGGDNTATPPAGAMPAAGPGSGGATPPAPAAPGNGAAAAPGAIPDATGAAGTTPAPGATPATPPAAAAPVTPATPGPGLESALAAERKRADTAEKELKKLRDADLTENERLKKQVDELTAGNVTRDAAERQSRIRVAAVSSAARLGFADPEDAIRMIDESTIVFDDQGQPTNVPALAEALLKQKPYLSSAAARPSGSPDFGGSQPTITAADLAKMTPEQVAANWDKIMAGTGGKLPPK